MKKLELSIVDKFNTINQMLFIEAWAIYKTPNFAVSYKQIT